MPETPSKKWSWQSWAMGGLVALGVLSTYVAAQWGGPVPPESPLGVGCASSQIIFEQKRRCGFVDLGELVTATGCVRYVNLNEDGDQTIDIQVEEQYEHLLKYQGRKTRNFLHVEFMPCERAYTDVAPALQEVLDHYHSKEFAPCSMMVRVTGRWAYDGVDHRGEWRDQLGNCLGGREADPLIGWTEIHPAYSIEILTKQERR